MASGPAAAVAPSPETGAEIAARWCADCHVISPSGEGISRAPGFPQMADNRSHAEILHALTGPHAQPVKGFTLSPREVADVAAYIDSLKDLKDAVPQDEAGGQ
jgi:mono/diheme cytochrome c family protein